MAGPGRGEGQLTFSQLDNPLGGKLLLPGYDLVQSIF